MMNISIAKKNSVHFLLALCLFCLVLSSGVQALEKLEPDEAQKQQCLRIIQLLEKSHYLGSEMNNAISARAFDIYVKHLDPFRSLLTLADVTRFASMRNQWGDHLLKGNLSQGYALFHLCRQRDEKRLKFTLALIENWQKLLDFSSDDDLIIDRDERTWQPSEAALEILWKQELVNQIITLQLDDKTPEEITQTLTKIYKGRLARLNQSTPADVFDLIMNSVGMAYDPHTQYFPPRASEDFDIHMSLSLEGIGAMLQTEYEYTKVVRLVPKGPADKSKLLMPGDRIIGVGQGKDGEIVEFEDYSHEKTRFYENHCHPAGPGKAGRAICQKKRCVCFRKWKNL